MKTLYSASLGLLMFFSLHAYAQSGSENPPTLQSAPIDGGAIIMPPVNAPENTTQDAEQNRPNPPQRKTGEPPHHHGVSPDKAAEHGQQQTEPSEKKSLEDSCKGRPELCKQDSAR